MKSILKLNIIILFFTNISYSQCEIAEIPLDNGRNVVTMTEKIYQNEDLENGSKSFYLSTTNYVFANKESIMELVVTYVSIRSNFWIVPNILKIGLPSGKEIILKSNEKSSQTLNRYKTVPNNAKSVECYFKLNYEELLQILGEKEISYIITENYMNEQKFDITPNFKEQLSEMMRCVLKL